MEKEGLKRGLDFLEVNHLTVDYIVTQFLRERQVTQYYDVWHFEKGKYMVLFKIEIPYKTGKLM